MTDGHAITTTHIFGLESTRAWHREQRTKLLRRISTNTTDANTHKQARGQTRIPITELAELGVALAMPEADPARLHK